MDSHSLRRRQLLLGALFLSSLGLFGSVGSRQTAQLEFGYCGDGIVDPDAGESCDGSDINGASCNSIGLNDGYLFCNDDCTFKTDWCQYCGNGKEEAGEGCDDGNTTNGDGCDASCQEEPFCGDGQVCDFWQSIWGRCTYEECDDGNSMDFDGCNTSCKRDNYCGDNRVDPGENCDGGTEFTCGQFGYPGGEAKLGCNNSMCTFDTSNCQQRCGDGTVDAPEACDDGNSTEGDGCNNSCALDNYCGDNRVDPGENCDGSDFGGQNCSTLGKGGGIINCEADCTFDTSACYYCGDSHVDPGEDCDDGNTTDGDGCSSTCTIEPDKCGNGTLDPGEACDTAIARSCDEFRPDRRASEFSICQLNCTSISLENCTFCSNGAVESEFGEECDDENLTDGDGCSSSCKLDPTCGNGLPDIGEECDDGNTTSGDGCSSTCTTESTCGNGIIEKGEICDGENLAGKTCADFPKVADYVNNSCTVYCSSHCKQIFAKYEVHMTELVEATDD